MGKNLFVCIIVDDHIRPIFFQKWTEFMKAMIQQKFTIDFDFGMDSLLSVSDDYDYVLVVNSSVLFDTEHFMSLYYKMTNKDLMGAALRENANVVSCVENIEDAVLLSVEKLKERESPFPVDCASMNFLLMKKTMFEHLRKKETYAPIEMTIVDPDDKTKSTKGMLPTNMSFFLHLKDSGVRTWLDPTVQIKQILQAIV